MNPIDAGLWTADWAWSLPLIILTLVIHVLGLGFINEWVIWILSRAVERRRFMFMFVVVMGCTAALATLLHGMEAIIWAEAYRFWTPSPTIGRRCFIRSAQ